MFHGLKKVSFALLAFYLGLTALHLWLNVGLEKLGFSDNAAIGTALKLRVGFLPVT